MHLVTTGEYERSSDARKSVQYFRDKGIQALVQNVAIKFRNMLPNMLKHAQQQLLRTSVSGGSNFSPHMQYMILFSTLVFRDVDLRFDVYKSFIFYVPMSFV